MRAPTANRAGSDRQTVQLAAILLSVCLVTPAAWAEKVDYVRDIKPLLKSKCYSCHGALEQEADLRLDTGRLIRLGSSSGLVVVPGDADSSELIRRVSSDDPGERMPPEAEPLTAAQVDRLRQWIDSGAISPEKEQAQVDPRSHWAFQPLSETFPHATIDGFVNSRLKAAGLQPNPPADRRTRIRRLFLDLHGLPPTWEQVQRFVASDDPESWVRLVDGALASPRYGQRWAQHWLDIVRYADTHGFEVNTPRENAWPYRDYVIDAFNRDLPYDEFIRQQIAGDTCDVDAATGFLVAAPVLLPGQIGKDDASKRLARQDELDEIIIGTTATFLGLTVGCARCHDHKFDPISQRDYYAFQAFFTGVRYGDRPIEDAARRQRIAEAEVLRKQIDLLRSRLLGFEPPVVGRRTLVIDDEDEEWTQTLKEKRGHGENPDGTGRGQRDDPGDADRLGNLSRGRYTWWTNVPGDDVFVYSPQVDGEFEIWISWGVHGSGVHTRDARYVLDEDGDLETRQDQRELARVDQYHPAGISDGATEKQPLWSGLRSIGIHSLNESTRLIVRSGETGTGITADAIVLQEPGEVSRGVPALRAPVNARRNVERFAPVPAKFVRFTVLETVEENRHEPCLDELEVYAPGRSENLALAERGTKTLSSSNVPSTEEHRVEFVNDGRYGNERSWISGQRGGGWVQLEFPEPIEVGRIEWGRDRNGRFEDRLPVRYRIDVSADGDVWTTVADHTDRLPFGTPCDPAILRMRECPVDSVAELAALQNELDTLQVEFDRLVTPQMVYGGTFGDAEQAWLLSRGDPEQRLESVSPAIPAIFGEKALPESASDTERRVRLAQWLASPHNPLTARVMVNRLWQYHFGEGLVDSASDFGLNGPAPSHPQLLDWLAREFVRSGWSVKQLHRLILLSQAYQRSGQIDPHNADVDSRSRLLWRFPSRRIEAEAIRDSMLFVNGRLNDTMGGPGFNFFKSRGGLSGFPAVEEYTADQLRRMIFAHRIRMEPVPVFGAFDCPDAGQPMPSRSRSTTAIQALNLFNSPFVIEQAEEFARRVVAEVGDGGQRQVQRVFEIALGRPPTENETALAGPIVGQHGLASLCRAVFNSNEFLFLP